MSKEWFRHDVNARHDPKIVLMRAMYGAEGYGIYWMIIETLRETEGYKLPRKQLPALHLDFAVEHVEQFIKDCVEYDLLSDDGEYIWSESLLTRMDKYETLCEQRAEYGRKGGLSKASAKQELEQKGSKQVANRVDKTGLEKNRVEKKDKYSGVIDEIFVYFKETTGSRARPKTEALRSKIRARLEEGYTLDECKRAIKFAYVSKKDNPDQAQYIRIETIFAPSHFSGYLDAQVRYSRGKE